SPQDLPPSPTRRSSDLLEKGARPAALFASQHKHERLQITPRFLHYQGNVCPDSLHCVRHAGRRQVSNRCPHGPVRIVTNGVRRRSEEHTSELQSPDHLV